MKNEPRKHVTVSIGFCLSLAQLRSKHLSKMTTCRPSYVLSVVLVNFFILTSLCTRTMATETIPSNVALVAGSSTTLHCAPGRKNDLGTAWIFVAAGTSAGIQINSRPASCTSNATSFPQYKFNATDTENGQCDLIINDVTPSEAGWYQCSAFVTGGFAYNAQVTVLYSNPNCTQNVTMNVAVGDDVSMKCEVSYSSDGINASMAWYGCPHHYVSNDTHTIGNITTTVSELYIVAQEPSLEICTCNTTTGNPASTQPPGLISGVISPSTEHYSSEWNSTKGIRVQYCPDNVTMFPPTNSTLPLNSIVTCQANGYPSPIFFALSVLEPGGNQTTLTLVNSSLTLSIEGIYYVNCSATNYIISGQQGNFPCTNRSLVYVYNVSSEATTPAPTNKPTDSPSNSTYNSPKESCPTTTCIVPICVVCGCAVLAGAGVAAYFGWRHVNRHGRETTPQQSLKETPNGTENEIAGYEMSPTATQSQPDVTRHSRGGYPPSQQEPPVRSPEILPVSKVDPAGVGVVYAELQPQPQVNNRPGSRQPLQFQADNTGEYSHVKYA